MEGEILDVLEKLRKYVNTRYPMLKNQADDILSFAYIQYRSGRNIKTQFYYMIADYFRDERGGKNKKKNHISLEQITHDGKNPLLMEDKKENKNDALYEEMRYLIMTSLGEKKIHREVMLLYLNGMKKKEIAKKLHCSASYISVIFRDSKAIMKEYARFTKLNEHLVDD